jgi:predicted ATP-grasp superfamily ATP-dependent carboligase
VLGQGITVLGVQRILAAAGIPYFIVERDDPFVTRSRFYRPLPEESPGQEPLDLETWLSGLALERAVLLPCSDRWVSAVAGLASELRERFPSSTATTGTLDLLIDKGRFAGALDDLEIPHPRSRTVTSEAELAGALDEGWNEGFLKPRDSGRFFAEYGVKAFRAGSASELAERLGTLTAAGHGVIVQEYVPGPPSNHIFIDGFRDRSGRIRALFARRRLRMYPPWFGNSTFMRSVPIDEVKEAAEHLDRLLAHTRYRGVFSAEFKRDADDGRYKLLEVNTRPWWYVEFAARCGVDVCSMAYRDALEEPVRDVASYRTGATCVYPYMDYFACRELRRTGDLTAGDWIRSWASSSQPVFRLSDPWPAVRATAGILSGRIRSGRKRLS